MKEKIMRYLFRHFGKALVDEMKDALFCDKCLQGNAASIQSPNHFFNNVKNNLKLNSAYIFAED